MPRAIPITLSLAMVAVAVAAAAPTGPAQQAPLAAAIKACATPYDRSRPDFSAMDARIAKARLIGVGQQTHGTKEIFEGQVALVEYLVSRHGVRALLFEESHAGIAAVNDYIHGQRADGAAMAQGLMTPWRSRELQGLFTWMRGWNREHPTDPVEIAGIDNGDCTVDRSIADVLAGSPSGETVVPKARMRALGAFILAARASASLAALTLNDALAFRLDTMRLVRHAEAACAAKPSPANEAALFAARSLDLEVMEANEGMRSDPKRVGRELPAAAFDTTDWQRDLMSGANAILYAELHPTRRIALWAHGFHLGKNGATGRKGASDIGTMGTILSAHLAEGGHPDAYCCVTFTTGAGTVTALKATEVVAAMGDGTVSGRYGSRDIPAQRDGALETEVRRALGGGDWVLDMAKASGGALDTSVDMTCVGSEIDLEDDLGRVMRCEPAKSFDFIVVLGKTSSTPFLPKFALPE